MNIKLASVPKLSEAICFDKIQCTLDLMTVNNYDWIVDTSPKWYPKCRNWYISGNLRCRLAQKIRLVEKLLLLVNAQTLLSTKSPIATRQVI